MPNEKPKRRSITLPGNTPTNALGISPRNWLVPVILLSLREWSSYGYELMERASAFGFEGMNPGTLYRTLRQLEEDGLAESSWETSKGGPARRMYVITGSGEAYLRLWQLSLERYQKRVDAFLKIYAGGS